MRKITLLFLLIAGTTLTSFGQETPDTVEIPAQFPGGREALFKYLAENIRYPDQALSDGVSGKCYAKFVISSSGNVSDVQIVKGVPDCPACDQEVIRVISAMPNWTPAMNDGKAVYSYYNLPVVFHAVSRKTLRNEKRARRKNGDF